MLELIRRYSNSIVVKIFLAVLAITFLLSFGISGLINRLLGKDYLVQVGDIKITTHDFQNEKHRKLDLMRSRVKHIDDKAESAKIFYQMVWESVISVASRDFGINVSDDVVQQYLGSDWKFRDESGHFSANLLRGFLRNAQIPEQVFIDFSRNDLKKVLMCEPFRYVSAHTGLDEFIKSKKEKRTLTILELNPPSFPVLEKPTEEDLEEFRTANASLFETKETRSFKILKLTEAEIEKTIEITPEELQEAYEFSPEREDKSFDELKEELTYTLKNEKLDAKVSDITRQIEDSLIGGEAIEEVAQKAGISPIEIRDVNADNQRIGSNESVIKEKYGKDVVAVAFSVDEGDDSSFFEALDENNKRIFLLVHVDSVNPKHVEELSKISEKVKKAWFESKQKEKALDLAKEFVDEKSKEGESLLAFAVKNGRIARTSKPFNRDGTIGNATEKENDKDKKKDEDSVVSAFYKNAFSLEKDEAGYGELNGKVIVYQVKEIIPNEDVLTDREKLMRELSAERTDDLYQQAIHYFSEKYKLDINENLVKEVVYGESSSGGGRINVDDMF